MEKVRVCFTTTDLHSYSETFIQILKFGLDANVFHCYGAAFPYLSEDRKLQSYKSPPLIDLIKHKTGLIRSLKEYYLIRYFKSQRINLIFANYGPSGAELASIAKDLEIPLIVHFHGFDASIHEVLRKYQEAYQRMFSIARAIIVVSEEMKTDLIAIGAPKEKIFKMTYSPNSIFLKVTPDYQSNQVLAIGRFVEKKAPYLTLLAFQKAKERCPDLSLKYVGSGELMTVCQDLSKALKITDVHFVGVLSPEEIAVEMTKSFCFIQHSKQATNGDKEGTPVAILEAMAAGLPVISTNHAGIAEVVNDEINGYLVAEGDVEMMSRRLIELFMDRTLVMKLGQNGKHFIAINFSLEDYQKKINVLIKESLVNG